MSERERLAADARRIEWLADAMAGPAHVPQPPPQSALLVKPRGDFVLGLVRRGFAAALSLTPRARAPRWQLAVPSLDRVAARKRLTPAEVSN